MANGKARCPVCGRFQFRLIPGSECYCACGTRFLVSSSGEELSLEVIHVPSTRRHRRMTTPSDVGEPVEVPNGKTDRFT